MPHRKMVEEFLERKLYSDEEVHHINRMEYDNRLENFFLFESQVDHLKFHTFLNRYGVDPNFLKSNLERIKAQELTVSSGEKLKIKKFRKDATWDSKKDPKITEMRQVIREMGDKSLLDVINE